VSQGEELMKRLIIIFSASILFLLVLSGCGNLFAPQEVLTANDALVSRSVSSSVYYPDGKFLQMETGILGPEADYSINLPYGWQNFSPGEKNLLIYAHGYVTPDMDFSETEEYALINGALSGFVGQGFAVAYSNYADSGWAVKDGTIRTRQLRGYFVDKFGMPDNIYLCGVSEGAIIAIKLAEQNPELFSGVLAFAGPIGGAKMEFDYILNVRLAFDHFFKEAVKYAASLGSPEAKSLALALGYAEEGEDSSAVDVRPDLLPPSYSSGTVFSANMAALIGSIMMQNPTTVKDETFEMASVAVDGSPLFPAGNWSTNPAFIPEFVFTVTTALWYNIYGTQDLLEKTHGHMPMDNTGIPYIYMDFSNELPSDFEIFEVERFESSRDAEQYLKHWYQPVGGLRIPVVTLHFMRDPAVPYFHETAYKGIEGTDTVMLTQISIDGFGHGTLLNFEGGTLVPKFGITLGHIVGAFNALFAQVPPFSTP